MAVHFERQLVATDKHRDHVAVVDSHFGVGQPGVGVCVKLVAGRQLVPPLVSRVLVFESNPHVHAGRVSHSKLVNVAHGWVDGSADVDNARLATLGSLGRFHVVRESDVFGCRAVKSVIVTVLSIS